jgi:hypothetical protein
MEGHVPRVMVNLIRWSLLVIFVVSLATAVTVRSNGYTGVESEGNNYYVTYKSTRYEVSHEEFEETRWRNRVNGIAVASMMISLFAFIGIESVRFGGRRHIPRPRVGVLKLPTASGRGPAH